MGVWLNGWQNCGGWEINDTVDDGQSEYGRSKGFRWVNLGLGGEVLIGWLVVLDVTFYHGWANLGCRSLTFFARFFCILLVVFWVDDMVLQDLLYIEMGCVFVVRIFLVHSPDQAREDPLGWVSLNRSCCVLVVLGFVEIDLVHSPDRMRITAWRLDSGWKCTLVVLGFVMM